MDLTPFQNALSFVLAMLGLSVVAAVFAAVLVLLLRGRLAGTDALVVKDASGSKKNGLPFYIKVGVTQHETSYLETLVTCTLTAEELTLDDAGKTSATRLLEAATRTVSWAPDVAQIITTMRSDLLLAQTAPDAATQLVHWRDARTAFDRLPAYDGALPTAPLPVISNTLVSGSRVDYDQQLFLNTTQPLIGSAELTAELASDGTLSKTTVKTQDSTFETLLDALPVDTFFKSGGGAAAAQDAGVQESLKRRAGIAYRFTLEMQQSHVRHVFFREVDGYDYLPPIPPGDQTCWYRRELVESGTDAAKESNGKETQDKAAES